MKKVMEGLWKCEFWGSFGVDGEKARPGWEIWEIQDSEPGSGDGNNE